MDSLFVIILSANIFSPAFGLFVRVYGGLLDFITSFLDFRPPLIREEIKGVSRAPDLERIRRLQLSLGSQTMSLSLKAYSKSREFSGQLKLILRPNFKLCPLRLIVIQ